MHLFLCFAIAVAEDGFEAAARPPIGDSERATVLPQKNLRSSAAAEGAVRASSLLSRGQGSNLANLTSPKKVAFFSAALQRASHLTGSLDALVAAAKLNHTRALLQKRHRTRNSIPIGGHRLPVPDTLPRIQGMVKKLNETFDNLFQYLRDPQITDNSTLSGVLYHYSLQKLAPTTRSAEQLVGKLDEMEDHVKTMKDDLLNNMTGIESILTDMDNTTDDSMSVLTTTLLNGGGMKALLVLKRLDDQGELTAEVKAKVEAAVLAAYYAGGLPEHMRAEIANNLATAAGSR